MSVVFHWGISQSTHWGGKIFYSESVNRAGASRGLDVFTECGQTIHVHCRRDIIHQRTIKVDINNNTSENNSISLRSKSSFDFLTKCLFVVLMLK